MKPSRPPLIQPPPILPLVLASVLFLLTLWCAAFAATG
jgi:hypothetical protein